MKVKFMIKRHPQEFQVLKYIRTMSSHGLHSSIDTICSRFGLDEQIVQDYVTFLIHVGEIIEQQEGDEKIFVTDKWFLRKK